uniref:PID domain-containing protein n=1 Tax=Eptatretus burgeri TaxID=7764 RepID=A0A8C4R4M7_EPTBU
MKNGQRFHRLTVQTLLFQYMGCIEVMKSMRALDFTTRTQVTRENPAESPLRQMAHSEGKSCLTYTPESQFRRSTIKPRRDRHIAERLICYF